MTRRAYLPLLAMLGMLATSGCRAAPVDRADQTISYGRDPLQHVDLWRPGGKGPFPVILMIHGGCWRTDFATAGIMDRAAADLRRRGIAVWNVEYRGVDRPGGDYPGTFQDIAAAADLLARVGPHYRLRSDRVVAIGHSAGGHLALWLGGRPGISAASPLHAARPLRLSAIISLGGLPDLAASSVPPGDTCGADAVPRLIAADRRPNPFSDTSPAGLTQPNVPIMLINGSKDGIAPPASAEAYAARVKAPRITRIVTPGDDHMDEIAPGTASWTAASSAAIEALRQH